ncbi:MAG: aminoacyl-histidine dipeptidase [Bacteroidales bacterium]|nr:aminoacyl-histidine dipeptidase [Bacteroidales bacterium]
MIDLSTLDSKLVWENFKRICSIPHPSKHEEKITASLMQWAKEHHIEARQDAIGNIIMRKPATPGMENRKKVILQGHIDMVPQKNSDKKHDFLTDPIEMRVCEDGWVRANGTTLGADNGIGVAAAMSVMQSDNLVHGPLEALVTVDEETGMTGASNLKAGELEGDIFLNMDSETEGELYVGCAGGLDATIEIPYKETATPAGMKGYRIEFTGFKGGHSGMDIDLGRANVNKLINRLLYKATKECGMRISSITGGSLRNAIPREAFATVAVPADKAAAFEKLAAQFAQTVKNEFSLTEPDGKIEVKAADTPAKVMEIACQKNVINTVYALPNGVLRMSDSMKGLVETSSNLAIIKSENGKVTVMCLLRSSVDSAKEAVGERMSAIAEMAGAEISLTGAYPGWKPNMESPILKTMMATYRKLFNKDPEIKAIHAGLECGLLGGVYPNWDMISFGPTIMHPHSPDEKVNIESVDKFWKFLVETLVNIPVK